MTHSRKIFKDLGYNVQVTELPFGKYIEYNKTLDDSLLCISFLRKTINCRMYENKKIELPPTPMIITPEEIKAIYHKCLEMGWITEDE